MTTLITGANRGIGRALFDGYRDAGETVIGTARHPGGADGFLELDVTDPQSQRDMFGKLAKQPIDLLICNAGIYPDKGHQLDTGFGPEIWTEGLATNVTGVFLTIQTLLPNIRAARGKIAIISSKMASQALAPGGSYVYRASKAAVLNLGRNLAADLAPEGIAVGIYHPGWVQTDMGGAAADIDTTTAMQGLMTRFAALSVATTGCFETWDGQDMPL